MRTAWRQQAKQQRRRRRGWWLQLSRLDLTHLRPVNWRRFQQELPEEKNTRGPATMSGHRQAGGGSETSAQNAVFKWSTFPVIFERPMTKQRRKPSSNYQRTLKDPIMRSFFTWMCSLKKNRTPRVARQHCNTVFIVWLPLKHQGGPLS